MTTVVETDAFVRALSKLPKRIHATYERQKEVFARDWHDARLHVKKLVGLDGVFSFRVTRTYRVLFYFSGNRCVIFFMIDHRKDVYR